MFIQIKTFNQCHNHGFQVYPFTIDKQKRYDELITYGTDGVFSNNPNIFSKVKT